MIPEVTPMSKNSEKSSGVTLVIANAAGRTEVESSAPSAVDAR